MSNNVSSQSNINMIIEIISSSIPHNILNNMHQDLKQFIYNRCNWYHKERLKFNGLKDMNQRIIKESYQYTQKRSKQSGNPNNLSNIHTKKGKDFDLRLKSHQDNFNTLINGNKPNEIDFSDKLEEEGMIDNDNMGYIMSQTLNDREKELERITMQYSQNDTNNASNWINKDKPNDDPIKIKIKENIKLDNITEVKKRRVTFNTIENEIKNTNIISNIDIINEIKDFMNGQNNVSFQNIVLEKLETIIKNQDIIIKNMNIKKKTNPTSILKDV